MGTARANRCVPRAGASLRRGVAEIPQPAVPQLRPRQHDVAGIGNRNPEGARHPGYRGTTAQADSPGHALAPVEAADVAVTWYGHSSVLVEVEGYRVLADPVWSRRVSPSTFLGPSRMHPTPVPLSDLPAVDAIVISHDHYDHLDMATVRQLVSSQKAPFVVPVGLGAHLRRWRVPEERIVELDWDESTTVGALTLTCTEARHFSGRGFVRNTTQWASWVLAGPERTVFFGGDSGYTPRFADLGRRYGPFDLTLLPVGAYDPGGPIFT